MRERSRLASRLELADRSVKGRDGLDSDRFCDEYFLNED